MTATFARRTGMLAAGQASIKATQLVLAILLVRILSPDEWNETAFLLSIYLAATVIGTLNLQHGLVFAMRRLDRRHHRSLVVRNVGVLLAIGGLIAVALTIAAPSLSGGRLGEAELLPWLGLAIALELPAAVFAYSFVAAERFGVAALWDLTGTAVVIVCTVVGASGGSGTAGVIGGLVAAGALRLLVGLVCVIRVLPPGDTVPMGCVVEQLVYSVPLGLTVAVSTLNRLVDKWLVAVFDSGNFGIYAIAAQEVPLLAVVPYAGGTALSIALIDSFHRGDVAVARSHWLHLTMTMSTFVVPLAAALILVAPELLTAVFTADFEAGVVPFQLFTLITLHRVAEYGLLLRAAGRTRALLSVAAVTLGANAVLAGFGAWSAGMIGASIGTVIASAVGWWFVLRHIADALGVPVRAAFAWEAWLSCVVLAGVAGVAAQVVTDLLAAGTAARLVTKLVVFAVVLAGGLRWWHAQPRSAVPGAIAVPEEPTRSTRAGAAT